MVAHYARNTLSLQGHLGKRYRPAMGRLFFAGKIVAVEVVVQATRRDACRPVAGHPAVLPAPAGKGFSLEYPVGFFEVVRIRARLDFFSDRLP